MTAQARFNLFQLINVLYEYRSIILTTNKDFTDWGEFFHHDNVAIPIIDRVIHHSNIFMLGGESYRLKQKTSRRSEEHTSELQTIMLISYAVFTLKTNNI